MSLYSKLLAAQRTVKPAAKDGRTTFHNYDYATEKSMLESAKDALHTQGLMVLSTLEMEEIGIVNSSHYAKVVIDYTVVDAESGESVHSRMAGYAEDTIDKALHKAITGANKYFYLKFLGLPTDDDTDADESLYVENLPAKTLYSLSNKQQTIPDMRLNSGKNKSVISSSQSDARRLADRIYKLIQTNTLTEEEVQCQTDPEQDRPYRHVIDNLVRLNDTCALTKLGIRLRQYAGSISPEPDSNDAKNLHGKPI